MTEPTDAELDEIYRSTFLAMPNVARQPPQTVPPMVRDFARAVLAKWGTPPGWLPFPLHLQNPDGRTLRTSAYLLERHGYKECSVSLRNMADVLLATTPQPTQAQAGAVPLTDEQWQRIADLTDSILTRATKDEIERVIGIKGGQHGADT